jgi:hypothetical protein
MALFMTILPFCSPSLDRAVRARREHLAAQYNSVVQTATNEDQRCEVQFYLGEWDLLHERRAEAASELREAVDSCPKNLVEYTGAVAEVKRLGP